MKQGLLTGVEASQILLLASKEAIDGRKPLMAEGIHIENINLKGGTAIWGRWKSEKTSTPQILLALSYEYHRPPAFSETCILDS
jgi:hypothetical protein